MIMSEKFCNNKRSRFFDIASKIEKLEEEDIKEINKILQIWESDNRISKTTAAQVKKIWLEAKGAWDDI